MLNYLRPFCKLAAILVLALIPYGIFAQNFIGKQEQVDLSESVKKELSQWTVFRLNPLEIKQFIEVTPDYTPFQLQLGDKTLNLQLEPSRILAPDYHLVISSDAGLEKQTRSDHRAFKGTETGSGGMVRLTLDKNFMHGFIQLADDTYFIEPLWYHMPDADPDLFLFYPERAVIPNQDAGCLVLAAEETQEHGKFDFIKPGSQAESMACYELEIAIASDKSMHTKYGSVIAVENHNIAVLNDAEGLYSGSFIHDITFFIVTQFVVTGTDPWTSSTDAGVLLGSFRSWGNGGGFGVSFDNGELWTNRNFDGSTVGIAYLGGLCNNNRYHCLQDYTSNSTSLRNMTAHEIGHNFTATHDNCPTGGPQYVMCPFVNSSTQWSSNSENQINGYITQKINQGCLEPCGGNPPLEADFDWSPNQPCEDVPVQFTDLSSGNISSRTWSFPGGSPPSSNQTNPTVTYFSPGTYTVSLTLNGTGGPVTESKQITVLAKPVSDFTYAYDDLTYNFTSTATNAFSYSWDFGDGIGTSSEQNPVYTYSEAGIYVVTLFVENDCGTSTKSVTINTVPTANFTADPTSGCATLTVEFNNQSSSNASSYLWQFPGGSPVSSTLPNPVVVYTTSGTYTVSLTAYNGAGSNNTTFSNYITVQNVPSANFTKTVDNLTVTFTNTSVGGTSYLWNFGDGDTSTQQHPVHTYAVGGSYTVTLTTTNACGSTTNTQTVNLIAPPAAGFTADVTSGCGPLTVNFTNTTTGNADSYNWSFPGGSPSSSTEQNPTVVYNNPGTYTVSLTATNAGGSNTATQTNFVTVNGVPAAGFTTAINLDTVQFNNGSSGGATAFNWNFGDGETSTQQNPVHIYGEDGVYIVTLIATNACGADTITQSVTIVTPPTANFSATPTSGCGPLTVSFANTSSDNAATFSWSFPGGSPASSTAENPVVVYNAPGMYTVTLVVTNAAGSNTATQTNYITVNPGPTAGFSSSINGLIASFTNTSTNSTSYSWDFGDMTTSNLANPTHSYDEDGTYTVVLTATNACGTNTFTQTITILTPPTAGFSATPTSGCGPLSVTFMNASSANATSFNWSFPGGAPASSTVENPTVVYNTPGTYSVTLVVTNAAGSNTATQTNYITVNAGPTAGFTSSVNGAVVNFTNTSTNSTTYAWDFGDMSNSAQANPTHTYSADGTYTVTLTATNPCGTNTFTETVTIVTPPSANFTVAPSSGCGPLTVQFTNSSSANATTFSWSFPGGTPSSSTEESPTVVYNTPGTYSVTLVASNSAGSNTAMQTSIITVESGPTAGFTLATNGSTVGFTNNSTNSASYLWDFGDSNTSTEQNPSHTYLTDGTYTVTLTATNPCGTSTYTETVTIVTPPIAGFSANVTEGCAPLEVQFTNSSSANATSYAWTFEGGHPAVSSESDPVVLFNDPGIYTVTLVATNSAGSNTTTSTITVLGPPTAGFTTQTAGLSVVLTNNSSNAGSYVWIFGDGDSTTVANPTHTYGATGDYVVILIAENECGISTDTQVVSIVGSAPIPSFTASEVTGCAPFTVQFTDQSAGSPTAWLWTFEGGDPAMSTEQNPTVTFSAPGSYSVTLEASNLFGNNTSTVVNYITVLDLPKADFSFLADQLMVQFTNASQNGDMYSWKFGDGETSTEQNPAHTYTAPGTYTVELTVINNCGASTLQQMVVLVSATGEATWLNMFRLYPNPSSGQFTVEMAGDAQRQIEFVLHNGIGQMVDRQIAEFNNGTLSRNFDYSNQPAGMYTLTVRSGTSAFQTKIAIQR
ncbi:MAG: PKD domain-containing protein [Saprospiraceae bacterium]